MTPANVAQHCAWHSDKLARAQMNFELAEGKDSFALTPVVAMPTTSSMVPGRLAS